MCREYDLPRNITLYENCTFFSILHNENIFCFIFKNVPRILDRIYWELLYHSNLCLCMDSILTCNVGATFLIVCGAYHFLDVIYIHLYQRCVIDNCVARLYASVIVWEVCTIAELLLISLCIQFTSWAYLHLSALYSLHDGAFMMRTYVSCLSMSWLIFNQGNFTFKMWRTFLQVIVTILYTTLKHIVNPISAIPLPFIIPIVVVE